MFLAWFVKESEGLEKVLDEKSFSARYLEIEY